MERKDTWRESAEKDQYETWRARHGGVNHPEFWNADEGIPWLPDGIGTDDFPSSLFDHIDRWEIDGQTIAVTTQPYDDAIDIECLRQLIDFCDRRNLNVDVMAGWHYVGKTIIFTFTPKRLPNRINGILTLF